MGLEPGGWQVPSTRGGCAAHGDQRQEPPFCSQQHRQKHSEPSSPLQPERAAQSQPQLPRPGQVEGAGAGDGTGPGAGAGAGPSPKLLSLMFEKTVSFMLQDSGRWHTPPSSHMRSSLCQASRTSAMPSDKGPLIESRLSMNPVTFLPSCVKVMLPWSRPPSVGKSILKLNARCESIVNFQPGPKSLVPLPNFTIGEPPWSQAEDGEKCGGCW
mmetsp:Transcript_102422/g.294836  ORF Transcript_102422/g.294836 Transcript_102422/m.294836 type:complete len:213 (-) Transcript_102422:597-1235(-)